MTWGSKQAPLDRIYYMQEGSELVRLWWTTPFKRQRKCKFCVDAWSWCTSMTTAGVCKHRNERFTETWTYLTNRKCTNCSENTSCLTVRAGDSVASDQSTWMARECVKNESAKKADLTKHLWQVRASTHETERQRELSFQYSVYFSRFCIYFPLHSYSSFHLTLRNPVPF